MELVFVVTFAGLFGSLIRYLVPGRDRHGLGLMPSVAIIVATLSWVAVVWMGLEPRSAWPWIISFGLSIAATVWLGLWLPKKRDAADAELFERLTDTRQHTPTP